MAPMRADEPPAFSLKFSRPRPFAIDMSPTANRRVLVVDDSPSVHRAAREALGVGFDVYSAFQGEDAAVLVEESLRLNAPFALALVDVRMPPGWDGARTADELRERDPALQVVMMCASSEKGAALDVFAELLDKPLDVVETSRLAASMTAAWASARRAREAHTHPHAALGDREADASPASLRKPSGKRAAPASSRAFSLVSR